MQVILVPSAVGGSQLARLARAGTLASLLKFVPLIVICWSSQSFNPQERAVGNFRVVEWITDVTVGLANFIFRFALVTTLLVSSNTFLTATLSELATL